MSRQYDSEEYEYGYERAPRRMTREQAMAIRARKKRQQIMRRRRRRRIRILLIALILILALLGGLIWFVVSKLGMIDRVKLNNLQTYYDSGPYTNIAFFGLDSRNGELDAGVNSDTIIICSINNETDEVKLVSVYRDTYLRQTDGYFRKANSAYQNGAEDALNMLNMNLDLDINNYVTINFKALANTIDLLGGIDVEMTAEEAYWLDGYIAETAEAIGVQGYLLPDQNGGTYHLSGVQATAYCRIRYTEGYDFKRTERQRIVLAKVLEKAKGASLTTLNTIVDDVFPDVSTSLTNSQILSMALHVGSYELVDSTGFPFENKMDWKDDNGSENVVPIDLVKNVEDLHTWLFPDQEYTVSDQVQEISNQIMDITGIYGSSYTGGDDN